jgi:hypothetical protein
LRDELLSPPKRGREHHRTPRWQFDLAEPLGRSQHRKSKLAWAAEAELDLAILCKRYPQRLATLVVLFEQELDGIHDESRGPTDQRLSAVARDAEW